MTTKQCVMPSIATSAVVTSASARVLVIDDYRQARESMADVLRRAGHQVETLASAIEALKVLQRERLRCNRHRSAMPGMTGLEFIHHLHSGRMARRC